MKKSAAKKKSLLAPPLDMDGIVNKLYRAICQKHNLPLGQDFKKRLSYVVDGYFYQNHLDMGIELLSERVSRLFKKESTQKAFLCALLVPVVSKINNWQRKMKIHQGLELRDPFLIQSIEQSLTQFNDHLQGSLSKDKIIDLLYPPLQKLLHEYRLGKDDTPVDIDVSNNRVAVFLGEMTHRLYEVTLSRSRPLRKELTGMLNTASKIKADKGVVEISIEQLDELLCDLLYLKVDGLAKKVQSTPLKQFSEAEMNESVEFAKLQAFKRRSKNNETKHKILNDEWIKFIQKFALQYTFSGRKHVAPSGQIFCDKLNQYIPSKCPETKRSVMEKTEFQRQVYQRIYEQTKFTLSRTRALVLPQTLSRLPEEKQVDNEFIKHYLLWEKKTFPKKEKDVVSKVKSKLPTKKDKEFTKKQTASSSTGLDRQDHLKRKLGILSVAGVAIACLALFLLGGPVSLLFKAPSFYLLDVLVGAGLSYWIYKKGSAYVDHKYLRSNIKKSDASKHSNESSASKMKDLKKNKPLILPKNIKKNSTTDENLGRSKKKVRIA